MASCAYLRMYVVEVCFMYPRSAETQEGFVPALEVQQTRGLCAIVVVTEYYPALPAN